MKNSNKALIFLAAVFLLGYLDWLTTVYGLLFCGGTELNPFISGVARSSMLAFSIIKLAAVSFTGFAVYEAVYYAKNSKKNLRLNKFVTFGVFFTILMLAVVVVNNVMVVFNL